MDSDPYPMESDIIRVLRSDMAPAASASVMVGGLSLPRLHKIVFCRMQRDIRIQGFHDQKLIKNYS
jgi:hypothetical protein